MSESGGKAKEGERRDPGAELAHADLDLTRITVDRAPDPIFWIRPDGGFSYVNEAATRVFGHSREDFLRLRISDIDPNLPEETIPSRWAELARLGSRAFRSQIRHADGRLVPVEVVANHIIHGTEEINVCIARDITARLETERTLRESEERFREMAELLPEAVMEADLDLNVTYANRRALEMFGLTRDAFREGLNALQGLVPEDRPRALAVMRDRRDGAGPGIMEYTGLRSDGSTFPILFHAAPMVKEGVLAGLRAVVVDLSEQRQAEDRIRWSTQWVESFIMASPMGIHMYFLEEDGRLIFAGANPAADRILGTDHAPLVGRSMEEAFPGLVGTEVPLRYRAAAEQGVSWQTEQIVYDQEGLSGAFEVVAFQTAPGAMAAMFLDVTERKRAEIGLRASEERLKLATRSGRIGVWEFDSASGSLDWDDQMYEIYGVSREDSPPGIERWNRSVHPDDFPEAEAQFLQVMREGETAPMEFRIVRPETAEVRHIRAAATPVRDEEGRLLRVIGTNLDVTESRRALDALRESESRFRSVIEQSNDAIYILLRNRFDLVNRRFCELTGLTPEEANAPGFSFWSIIAPESIPLLEERQARRARGEEVEDVYDFKIRTKDGRLMTLEASVTEVEYKGEAAIMGILRDVTEHVRLEDQLRQSQKMESIGRLSGGVAHDLNNLLSPILGYAEMLLEDFGPRDRRRESAQEIVEAAVRARDLVRQLLAFSRKQTLEFRPVDLNSLVGNFEKLLRRTIREDIQLMTSLAPNIPTVQADLGQVEQVIMNLAVNAQDAMPEGGMLTIETGAVELDESFVRSHPGATAGEHVLLAVSDTGVGMEPAVVEKVFEPFFTTKKLGTGLGLSTVYGIVKQHGGSIWVYSELGVGTTFKCFLPVWQEGARGREKPAEPEERAAARGTGTVLVVEDEPAVRSLTENVLRRQGYQVLTAKDGREALAALRSWGGRLDLVLTDVVLPGMNGRTLVEEVSRLFPDVKALYMSGYTDDVITRHGVLEGGIAFLQKPFTVRQLAEKVRGVLEEG